MRRFWLILTCAMLVLGTAACGDTSDDDDPSNNDPGPDGEPDAQPDGNPDANPDNNPDPGPALDCNDFQACGGDMVGSWSFAEACIPPDIENPFGEDCPDATFDFDFDVDGDIEINANNTYELNFDTNIIISVVVPKTCLPDCSLLGEDFDCQDTGAACDCTTTDQTVDTESGTWAVDGNTLTITPDDGDNEPEELAFCVSGDSALIQDTEEDPDGGPVPVIVLERK